LFELDIVVKCNANIAKATLGNECAPIIIKGLPINGRSFVLHRTTIRLIPN